MPIIIENIGKFLSKIPVSYLLALLGLLLFLLILLITRRKKSQARLDEPASSQPAEIQPTEALKILEPPPVTDRKLPDERKPHVPEKVAKLKTVAPPPVETDDPDVSPPEMRAV